MTTSSSLYDIDFAAWASHNANLLRNKLWSEVDIKNLCEELEDMAKKERHELISRLVILLLHLLKHQFQTSHRSRSWINSIVEQRYQVQRQLKLSPSLKTFIDSALIEAYPDAVKLAVKETSLPFNTFPKISPYTLEQILDEDFFP
ncbi:hypothetical protein TI03_05735 [Achromatium sp. WMS1]|nr:hypothetical protein TI03_05735 [Achromatium sp. WMS1]